MTKTSTTLVPKYGTYDQCLAVLEQETRIPKLLRLCDAVDNEMGATSADTTNDLIDRAVATDCKPLTVLSGYAHLLAAEKMKEQGFKVDAINREIDKAEAMLSFANLGGRHPWLPRAQNLKRRVNLKAYVCLGVAVFGLMAVPVVSGIIYQLILSLDMDIF